MTSSILFVGGEDIDFTYPSSTVVASGATTGQWFPDSTANAFRSGYARYAMSLVGPTGGPDTTHYMRNNPVFSSSQFWTSFRCNAYQGNGALATAQQPIRFVDSGGVVRLRIQFTTANNAPNTTFIVQKIDAAGTVTQIGSTSPGLYMSATNGSIVADKLDIFVNYAVSGTFAVYLNGTQTFNFSGDVTTNSQTLLAGVDFGSAASSPNSLVYKTSYSEIIVATRDTRNFSLVTQAPTANGNTHNWDGGTAANAAATSMFTAQTSPQFSGTAAQIQEYQVTPAIPTGNFSVISVVQKAQATVGSTGPSKFDFMVRTASTDYTSTPDTVPGNAWGTFSNNWDTNPNTSAPWATSDLPASSTSFNMGLKSVT